MSVVRKALWSSIECYGWQSFAVICLLNLKVHQIRRCTKLKDARDRDMSRLKESYEATIEEHEKVSRDVKECKINHISE